ncbi:MAG: hypothetical protein KGH89_09450 [Thaumarchaeota archaeon]|nr:hypothetical protein [Nitrososphaerota archaeon]
MNDSSAFREGKGEHIDPPLHTCYSMKGINITNHPPLEYFFGNTTQTQLTHDGAQIIINQTINRSEYKIGEKISITPELVNMGRKSVNIFYVPPLLQTEIKYENEIVGYGMFYSTVYPQITWN